MVQVLETLAELKETQDSMMLLLPDAIENEGETVELETTADELIEQVAEEAAPAEEVLDEILEGDESTEAAEVLEELVEEASGGDADDTLEEILEGDKETEELLEEIIEES